MTEGSGEMMMTPGIHGDIRIGLVESNVVVPINFDFLTFW